MLFCNFLLTNERKFRYGITQDYRGPSVRASIFLQSVAVQIAVIQDPQVSSFDSILTE